MLRYFAFSDIQKTNSFYYQQMFLLLYNFNNCITCSENWNCEFLDNRFISHIGVNNATYTTDDDGNLDSLLGIYLNHIIWIKVSFTMKSLKPRQTRQNVCDVNNFLCLLCIDPWEIYLQINIHNFVSGEKSILVHFIKFLFIHTF